MADDFWTEERIERAKELFAQGWSCKLIADAIGASRSAVGAKLSRMGIKRWNGNPKDPMKKIRITRVNSNSGAMRVTVVGQPASIKTKTIDIKSRMIPFLDLDDNGCLYPIGDLWCGNPKTEGSSYCAPHARLCGHAARPRTDYYVPSLRRR